MARVLDRRHAIARVAVGMLLGGLVACGGNPNEVTYSAPNSVVVADFLGNGYNDIAVASAVVSNGGNESPGFVAFVEQDTATPGTFKTAVHFPIQANPSCMAVGDMSGAGSVDIAVGNFDKGTISVLLQTSPHANTFQPAVNVATGGKPNDCALADLNGDGRLDLAIADGAVAGNLIILMADPSAPGKFGTPVPLALPYTGYGVAVGDLNGDGLPDIAVTSFDVNSSNGTVSIFFQDPAHPGSFLPRVDLAAPGQPTAVRIADIDKDGFNDLAISTLGPGGDALGVPGVLVMLQNSSAPGTFLASTTLLGAPALSLAVADLNQDGFPDIVTVSSYPQGTGTITIFPQIATAPGTFNTPVALSGLGNPVSVAVGDLNHDNIADMGFADATGAAIMTQSTATAGSFSSSTEVGH
ncbi:MAG TPA: VCBS repeat-containing protein [Steroidobacteraceae bacterium]|nr:VCBS repeat-containing protein [Steroidobacteraceae bacterium]